MDFCNYGLFRSHQLKLCVANYICHLVFSIHSLGYITLNLVQLYLANYAFLHSLFLLSRFNSQHPGLGTQTVQLSSTSWYPSRHTFTPVTGSHVKCPRLSSLFSHIMLQSAPKKFGAQTTWNVAKSVTAPKAPLKLVTRVGGEDGWRTI